MDAFRWNVPREICNLSTERHIPNGMCILREIENTIMNDAERQIPDGIHILRFFNVQEWPRFSFGKNSHINQVPENGVGNEEALRG
jgi:hypothetical protein